MGMTDYIEPTDEELLAALAAADRHLAELAADTDLQEPTT